MFAPTIAMIVMTAFKGGAEDDVTIGRWSYKILMPATTGANDTCEIRAASAAMQGGYSKAYSGVYRPTMWSAGARPSSDLLPANYTSGMVYGTDGVTQVGYVYQHVGPNDYWRAALWSGSADSFVNLAPNPAIYNVSEAHSVRSSIIVGMANHWSSSLPHPCMWTGPSHTFADLFSTQKQMQQGYAYATDGTLVGGSVIYKNTSYYHATIWNGTANSALDLNPAGYQGSEIVGMIPGVQVGYVKRAGFGQEAALWRGTTESLHIIAPEGVISSKLYDSDGTRFVGFVRSTGWASAAIWWGEDAATIEDIGALVKGADSTWAVDISSEPSGDIVVAGNAIFSTPVQITRGVVWRWSPLRQIGPEK